jgi:hypothetical protein
MPRHEYTDHPSSTVEIGQGLIQGFGMSSTKVKYVWGKMKLRGFSSLGCEASGNSVDTIDVREIGVRGHR